MATDVILPRVDMDMAAGKVSRWFVENRDEVKEGQVIFEIETDKATMEIEAPASGTIVGITGTQGQDIPVGSVVARIYGEGETLPEGGHPEQDIAPSPDGGAVQQPQERGGLPPRQVELAAIEPPDTRSAGPRATPLARRAARQMQIDLAQIRGTGLHGRVQHADVLAYANGLAPAIVDGSVPPAKADTIVAQLGTTGSRQLNVVWLRHGVGTPIVLVHGFGADVASWRPLLDNLPGGRSVIAVDLPGHGASRLHGRTSFAEISAAVAEALTPYQSDGIHLVGHSLGAAVAVAAASSLQLDVRSALLLSPAGLGPDINGSFIQGLVRATSSESLGPWLQQIVHDAGQLSASYIRSVVQARTDQHRSEQGQLAASLFPDSTQAFSVREALTRLTCTVKIVFGLEDRIIPAHHVRGLPGAMALHLFPNTGHMPQIEQRAAIGRMVSELSGGAAR